MEQGIGTRLAGVRTRVKVACSPSDNFPGTLHEPFFQVTTATQSRPPMSMLVFTEVLIRQPCHSAPSFVYLCASIAGKERKPKKQRI